MRKKGWVVTATSKSAAGAAAAAPNKKRSSYIYNKLAETINAQTMLIRFGHGSGVPTFLQMIVSTSAMKAGGTMAHRAHISRMM